MRSKLLVRPWIVSIVAFSIFGANSACNRAISEKLVSATKLQEIETRLKQLEDREEIRQLLMDYGRFLDQRDFVAFSRLFAEKEGEWTGGMGSAKGPDAIRKLMEDTIGKSPRKFGSSNYHVFTNETIYLDGDRAKAITKWIFVVQSSTNQPQLFYLGHYEDSIVRENGRWRFLHRVVYSDIPDGNPSAQTPRQ